MNVVGRPSFLRSSFVAVLLFASSCVSRGGFDIFGDTQSAIDDCSDVDCSGHGSCIIRDAARACVCDVGYVADGLACNVAPCDGELSVQTPQGALWPGADVQILPSGGCPPYSAVVTGIGSIELATFVYTAPINAPPSVDNVRIADSNGVIADVAVEVFGFVGATPVASTISANVPVPGAGVVETEAGLFLAGANPVSTIPNISSAAVYKSRDSGVSWTLIDQYDIEAGQSSAAYKISGYGSHFVTIVAGETSLNTASLVRASLDNGATWSTVFVGRDREHEYFATDLLLLDDDTYLLGMQAYDVTTGAPEPELRRCSIAQRSCSALPSWATGNIPTTLAANNDRSIIYMTSRTHGAGEWTRLWRSTDHGETFVLLQEREYAGEAAALDVSDNGQTIVWAHSWVSSPTVEYSFDGGLTWSTDVTGAADLWSYRTFTILQNGDLVGSGYCFATCGSGMRWVVNKRDFATGTWANTVPAEVNTGTRLYPLAGGSILAYGEKLKTSPDGAETFTDLPTLSSPLTPLARSIVGFGAGNAGEIYRLDTMNTTAEGALRSLVLVSNDAGRTWVEDDSADGVVYNTIVTSPTTGTVLVAGARDSQWHLLRRATGGTWAVKIDASPADASDGVLATATVSPDGTFIIVGYLRAAGDEYWVAAASSDDGLSWSELERFRLAPQRSARAHTSTFHNDAPVVFGSVVDDASVRHWIARRYDGTLWTVFDDFVLPDTRNLQPRACLSHGGNLYVVGDALAAPYLAFNNQWITRVYANGEWSTLDVFDSGGQASSITAMTDDSVVIGGFAILGRDRVAAIRRLHDGEWRFGDAYVQAGGAGYNALIECSPGRLCAGGGAYVGDHTSMHTLLRVLEPPN